jgi:hypothetical protein
MEERRRGGERGSENACIAKISCDIIAKRGIPVKHIHFSSFSRKNSKKKQKR